MDSLRTAGRKRRRAPSMCPAGLRNGSVYLPRCVWPCFMMLLLANIADDVLAPIYTDDVPGQPARILVTKQRYCFCHVLRRGQATTRVFGPRHFDHLHRARNLPKG